LRTNEECMLRPTPQRHTLGFIILGTSTYRSKQTVTIMYGK